MCMRHTRRAYLWFIPDSFKSFSLIFEFLIF